MIARNPALSFVPLLAAVIVSATTGIWRRIHPNDRSRELATVPTRGLSALGLTSPGVGFRQVLKTASNVYGQVSASVETCPAMTMRRF